MTEQQFSCVHCRDVIGIYEPLVIVGPDGARQTSRAAEPDLAGGTGGEYHRDCYAAAQSAARTSHA